MTDRDKFYAGFKPLDLQPARDTGPVERAFTVHLFRAPNCIRGWLSYTRPDKRESATLTVEVQAESGAKAKNKAITLANAGFKDLRIVKVNRDPDSFWCVARFPELMHLQPSE